MHYLSVIAILTAATVVTAHPGHHEALDFHELTRRFRLSKRCESQATAMNSKRWLQHNERRSLAARSNTTVVITTDAPYYDVIQNDTCVLTPEVTTGPYIWPRSQKLRQDMTENQPGVILYLDIGVLDTNTCEPVEGVLVDLWHCNATGSYSSFEALSPNTSFKELLAQLNKTIFDDLHTGNTTFLRGMWPTDANGIMEMKTIFPGFYI